MIFKSNFIMPFKTILILILSCLLVGCSLSIDGNKYLEETPKLSLETFFDGTVTAWGIVQNRSGDVVQRFEVLIEGEVSSNEITLDETFQYDVGEGPEKRTWKITKNTDGSYTGVANDIDKPAKGLAYGNGFNFIYEMDLTVDEKSYRVKFDDWFWALDDTRLMNRSYIKKFGIVVAEITIFMQRQWVS